MRLKSIKLAGFKSFVDPTTVHFPSNLCAVVGPNGCGKSNIIDAVRWVMGESSAKNLRGESMTDVIFNGAVNRQPVGQASIELIFDNSEGDLGGEYAGFAEIAVRRVVTREAISQYYLNGTRCRRRDITDIFLGTGLGPRSYAIIEQGTISRLIEAKPEELRVFIEEAAGISKYKERRRETENRMRRTSENMERLTDIREELERQLQHLKRQAQAAEKYGEYKREERATRAQYQAIQWRDLDKKLNNEQQTITQLEVDLEAVIAEHRAVDADLEGYRVSHTESNEHFNEVQAQYYSLGAEVARVEQSIQHQVEREQQLNADLRQTDEAARQAHSHLEDDQARIDDWKRELAEITPKLETLNQAEGDSGSALQHAEQTMLEWQQDWDRFNQTANEPRQEAEVQQSRIKHVEQVLERVQQRVVRAEAELQTFSDAVGNDSAIELEKQVAALELDLARQQGSSAEIQEELKQQRASEQQLVGALDQSRARVQEDRGRLASLEALQQAALGHQDDQVQQWLRGAELENAPRLGETISADADWQLAVETVLGEYLQAICVGGVDAVAAVLGSFEQGRLILVDASARNGESTISEWTSLLDRVGPNDQLAPLLANIYQADSLQIALTERHQLQAHESFITRDGVWIGPNWLRVSRQEDTGAGVISRQRELEELRISMDQNQEESVRLQGDLETLRAALANLEERREQAQSEIQTMSRAHAEGQAELTAQRLKLEQVTADRQRVTGQLSEHKAQYAREELSLSDARSSLQQAIEAMERDTGQRETLLSQRDSLRSNLESVRQQAMHDKDASHQLAIRAQHLTTQLESMALGVERTTAQLEQLAQRRSGIEENLGHSGAPIESMRAELASLLEQRLAVEQKLAKAREAVNAIEAQMREAESLRGGIEQRTNAIRSQLERHRVDMQGFSVGRRTVQSQLEEGNWDVKTVLSELPDEAEENEWQLKVERIASRITRLGPINLAAIDEFKAQSERKDYLDAQNADLERALDTLAGAIRKIDRETRSRFKDTFDKISQGIQELFPKVFGGGTAYLEMTGDDLLDTGVAIMARPPGKRNSTIHLLSGGEKALTAIALVFSIFRLNPAPFCMLDEVDAPLDDANVARYARMVREMAEQLQFIYITHNKISMEMADHLMGVTMHEPGVSRLVSVDVEEAAELAAV